MNAASVQNPTSISPQTLVISSHAKLNLFLDVFGKKADGYHEIETLFERISLSDTLYLTEIASDEVIIFSQNRDIPSDQTNLAAQAARLIKDSLGISKGVKIEIEKNIPVGAGLAGGSSNGASVLLGLNKLFGLHLNKKTLLSYANRLGSDVAFFVFNKKFAVGRGRGGELESVSVPKNVILWHILFVPHAKILTKDVDQLLDQEIWRFPKSKSLKLTRWTGEKQGKKDPLSASALSKVSYTKMLTKKVHDVNILLSLLKSQNIGLLNRHIYNRLSETVMKSYRFVSELKSDLMKSGLKHVHMSGSGPALFTTFKQKQEAERLYSALKDRFLDRCRVFLVSTQ